MTRGSGIQDWLAVVAATAAVILSGTMFAHPVLAEAAECPGNPDALGTSRTLVVDPAEHPRLGTIQYHETLPLEDHEIVLTFDDGPLPPRTSRVLDILDHECVKATFFLVGKMAHTFPALVRRIRDAGHTIGTHSYSHPLTFRTMPLDKVELQINRGIADVTAALGDGSRPAPFFRIPGLERADRVERYLASRHIQVWSADEVADDWLKIDSGQVYSRALQRIEAKHKGILLLHDIQPRTVEALPRLLRELKRRGYRIVHVVAASPDLPKTATNPNQWTMHAHLRPGAPTVHETETGSPAPSPAVVGLDVASRSMSSSPHGASAAHDPTMQPRPIATRVPAPLRFQPVSTWPDGPAAKPNTPDWSAQFQSIDGGGEPTGVVAVDEIQRLLATLPDDGAPSAEGDRKTPPMVSGGAPAVTPPPQTSPGPVANTVMPRGPFP